MRCYCGSPQTYAQCCEIVHKDHASAKRAEQLMRARYSAFVIGNTDFIVSTQHSSTRQLGEIEQIQAACQLSWCKLEIVATSEDKRSAFAYVEFKAWYVEDARLELLHENSRFCKEPISEQPNAKQAWFYLDGEFS